MSVEMMNRICASAGAAIHTEFIRHIPVSEQSLLRTDLRWGMITSTEKEQLEGDRVRTVQIRMAAILSSNIPVTNPHSGVQEREFVVEIRWRIAPAEQDGKVVEIEVIDILGFATFRIWLYAEVMRACRQGDAHFHKGHLFEVPSPAIVFLPRTADADCLAQIRALRSNRQSLTPPRAI